MYGSTSKFGDRAPQAWLLNIQYRYTHKQIPTNTKLKSLTHTITQPITHPHIHSLTDFGAIFVNDGGRIWARGGLQTTDLEQTFPTRQVSSKSAQD